MDIVLLGTEGRGGEARVEVDGHKLVVVDRVSSPEKRAKKGPVDARLEVVVNKHLSRPQTESGEAVGLEPHHGWRYVGTGEVIGTEPTRVDLGLLEVEADFGALARCALGDRVEIAIDRIVLEPS